MKIKSNRFGYIYISLGVLAILAFWAITQAVIDNSMVIPKISEVAQALRTLLVTRNTYGVLIKTVSRLLITLAVNMILTLILAYLSYKFVAIENLLKPLFALLRSVPVVTLIIILLYVAGNNLSPYFISSLVILPLMYEGILSGFFAIDNSIKDEIKLQSDINFRIINTVFVPITLPYITAAFVQSFGLGLKVMIMAEFLTQPKGTIGYELLQEKLYMNMSNIFAWTVILITFVLCVEIIVRHIKNKYFRFD